MTVAVFSFRNEGAAFQWQSLVKGSTLLSEWRSSDCHFGRKIRFVMDLPRIYPPTSRFGMNGRTSHFGMKMDDSHTRKKIRFLFDLFLIYPSFRNDKRLSFRNDLPTLPSEWPGPLPTWLPLSYDWPCSLISEAGRFSLLSYRRGNHFSCHSKRNLSGKKASVLPQISIPHFLPDFLTERQPSETEKSSQKNFRNLIIPEQKSSLRFWE